MRRIPSYKILQAIVSHPDLQGLRRFTLATGSSHGLYAQFGLTPPSRPQSLMERYFPKIYDDGIEQPGREGKPRR